MRPVPHLLVAITGHGFGHAAQACVVVRALRDRLPELRLTLRTTLPRAVLIDLFGPPFEVIEEPADPGLVMTSPFDVDVEASADAYAAFHEDWKGRVAREASSMAMLGPDIVLADVPYLPIAAAAMAGIPAYALCSLNWADLYRHYCGQRPEAGRIHEQIVSAYGSAEAFLIPEPGMPMDDLANTRRIGPCARIGRERGPEIRQKLGIDPDMRLVLVAMGGIRWSADLDRWPRLDGVHFLVNAADVPRRPDMSAFDELGCPMIDIVRSSDAVVTKYGYGLLTEAACNDTALLYLGREDWPEAPFGWAWARDRMRAEPITRAELADGTFGAVLERNLVAPPFPPVVPTGGAEAADILLEHIGRI